MGKQEHDRNPSFQEAPHIMVATDLSTVLIKSSPTSPPLTDRLINKKAYRLLDIPYYCWLRSRIDKAIVAVDTRKITIPIFDQICVAFDRVHRWVVTQLAQEELLQTFISFKPDDYLSPRIDRQGECISSFVYPKGGSWRHEHPITASALHKVQQIRAQALALGWSEQNLFQNRSNQGKYPFGKHWGLVTLIRPDYQIGKITRESIELVGPKPFENTLRFQNPAVESPYLKETAEQGEQHTAKPIVHEAPRPAFINHNVAVKQPQKQPASRGGKAERKTHQSNPEIKPQLTLFDL